MQTMENQFAKQNISILLADDLSEWRAQVRKILRARPEWRVIGEASDGLQAIQKASELQPTVVLLDIGMPSLNGIEAAKIIHQRCPKSKVLFVTQDGDDDIRNAAVQAGAAGYVLKTNAGNELLHAVTNALYGYPAAASTKSR